MTNVHLWFHVSGHYTFPCDFCCTNMWTLHMYYHVYVITLGLACWSLNRRLKFDSDASGVWSELLQIMWNVSSWQIKSKKKRYKTRSSYSLGSKWIRSISEKAWEPGCDRQLYLKGKHHHLKIRNLMGDKGIPNGMFLPTTSSRNWECFNCFNGHAK